MKEKLKVLHISLRADFGGGPEHVFQLLSWVTNGIMAYVACPNETPYYAKYVKLLGAEKTFILPRRKFSILKLIILFFWCCKNKIDILHSHGKGAGAYSRIIGMFLRIPVVHTFHGLHIGNYSPVIKSIYLAYERISSLCTNKIIAVSESEAKLFEKHRIATQDKIVVINNGVLIPSDSVRHSLDFRKQHILYVSRFDYSKNAMLFISILREIKEMTAGNIPFYIEVVGDGPEYSNFCDELHDLRLGDRVHLNGFTDNLPSLFTSALCIVSTSRWEAFGLAIVEAMAYGVPPIASRVTGHTSIISHGVDGFLFPLNNAKEAANLVLQLASDLNLRSTLSQNARRVAASRFSAQRMVQETENLYFTVVKP